MHHLRYLLLLALTAVLFSSPATACSCLIRSQDGFIPTPSGGVLSQPTLLPANAKGVLYRETSDPGDKKLPPMAEDFTFHDDTDNTDVAFSLKRLQGELLDGITRIEPVKGFVAGHEYTVQCRRNNQSVNVKINSSSLTLDQLADISFLPESAPETKLLSVPEGGGCAINLVSNVQAVAFRLPENIEPYREAMVYFVSWKNAEGKLVPWEYHSSLCSSSPFGKSELGAGKELFYQACAGSPPVAGGGTFALSGQFGFLQLEDSLRSAQTLNVSLLPLSEAQCSPATHLSAMSQNDKELEAQLCSVGQVGAGSSDKEGAELAKFAAAYLTDNRLKIRTCAAQTFERIPYIVQNILTGDLADRFNNVVIPGLGKMAGDETDSAARLAAVNGLRSIAHVGGPSSQHGLHFTSAVAGVAKALEADDKEVRVTAAEVLSYLGSDGGAAADTLRRLMNDPARPNYRAPTALAAVDPTNPATTASLLQALKNPDAIVRSTAAEGLGTIYARDADTISALTAAAKENNQEAIQALGKLGAASAPAVPTLKDMARKSQWSYVVQASMLSLAQIAPQDPQVVKIIGEQLKWKENDYTRQKALEALTLIGPPAKPLVPKMLQVLKEKPSPSEVSELIKALEAIRPDPLEAAAAFKGYSSDQDWVNERVAKYLERLK